MTGAPVATRRIGRRTWARSSASCFASTSSKPGAEWTIAGLGLRNAWRFSFDRATGDLYLGDVGQGAIEEVSFTPRVSPGLENYGWDLYEGSRRFEDGEPAAGKLVFPLYEYGRGEGNCSVIGGHVYRGSASAAGARALHLRRLLQRDRLEPAPSAPARRGTSAASSSDRGADLVRRERVGRALRHDARRRHLPADLAGPRGGSSESSPAVVTRNTRV